MWYAVFLNISERSFLYQMVQNKFEKANKDRETPLSQNWTEEFSHFYPSQKLHL